MLLAYIFVGVLYFGIVTISSFVIWLMANAIGAFILSSRVSKDLNEQDK